MFLNNYLGPDVGWVLGIGSITHSLFGWPFFALILALFYHYFTRFSLEINGIKNVEIIDLERYKLSYLNTYFLVLAGGIMHIYLDGIMNYGGLFTIIPQLSSDFNGLKWTLEDFMTFWMAGTLQINFVISLLIGITFIFGFVFVFVWYLKKTSIKGAIIVFLYISAFMVFYYLAGEMTTLNHPDAGAIIYVSLFWLTPLMLCVLSTRKFKFLKEERKSLVKSKDLLKKKRIITILKIIYLVIGLLTILGFILLFISRETLLLFLLDTSFFNEANASQILNTLTLTSISLGIIGTFEVLLWFYLRKCNEHERNLLVISIFLLILSSFGIILFIVIIFLIEPIMVYIFSLYWQVISVYISLEEIISLITILGAIILVLSLVNIACAFGFTIKNKIIWKFSTYYYMIFSWTIIGLTIACAISENSVKKAIKATLQESISK